MQAGVPDPSERMENFPNPYTPYAPSTANASPSPGQEDAQSAQENDGQSSSPLQRDLSSGLLLIF